MSFLLSSQRTFERDALSEAFYVISDVLGYSVNPSTKFRVPGLGILRLVEDVDPFDVMNAIRQYIEEKGPLVACLKVVPLERLIKTNLSNITGEAFSLAKQKILPTHSWKILVRKRQTNLRTSQIIENLAGKINWGTVKLNLPDLEIRIEVVRDLTGISVMKPHFEIRMADFESE
ncbi:MAG: THUMP domain-containing protein [Candidatus Hodarchaeales archaeon]|jgi:tRNA(Ser,Leu) C12 N-acetylase TAN1